MSSDTSRQTVFPTPTADHWIDTLETPFIASDRIMCGAWFSRDVLLLLVELPRDGVQQLRVVLMKEEEAVPLTCTSVATVESGPPRDGTIETLLVIRFPNPAQIGRSDKKLIISCGAAVVRVHMAQLESVLSEPSLLRRTLAGLEPSKRQLLLDLLTGLPRERGGVQVSRSLFLLREALRERLPCCVLAGDQTQGLCVESLLGIDERSFYQRGWIWDSEGEITQVCAISPEGDRVQLKPRLFTHPRPDVEQFYGVNEAGRVRRPGFLCYFELSNPSRLASGWIVTMTNAEGAAVETTTVDVVRDVEKVQSIILQDMAHAGTDDTLLANHIFPALSRMQEHLRAGVRIESVTQYGCPPSDPTVSIVVPLYGRIDFLEQQLVHFASDPDISRSDLIYVLDSPELGDRLQSAAVQLHLLYRVPFRVAVLNRNAGFSTASNLGASLARGRLLLLLNSDVLPARPGWLSRMVSFYDATPQAGAVGPKLLYEDDTLQHAGMHFAPLLVPGQWENRHYFKGLHRTLPSAARSRAVPAVTGACLLIRTALYRDLQGLRGMFVKGDYEDSDLCLRLIEAGYENWYLPAAELYHLEAQSYPNQLRQLTRRYNEWLHSHMWGERIEAVMARYGLAEFAAQHDTE